MPFNRRRFAASLTIGGSSILGLGLLMLLIKLSVYLAEDFAIPTVAVGLVALVAGWLLR